MYGATEGEVSENTEGKPSITSILLLTIGEIFDENGQNIEGTADMVLTKNTILANLEAKFQVKKFFNNFH